MIVSRRSGFTRLPNDCAPEFSIGGCIFVFLFHERNRRDVLRNRALLLQVKNGLEWEIVAVDADVAADVWHTRAVRAQDDGFAV